MDITLALPLVLDAGANAFDVYRRMENIDLAIHAVNTALVVAGLGAALAPVMPNRWSTAALATSLGIAGEALWEVAEFAALKTGEDGLELTYDNTMLDIISSSIGAALGGLVTAAALWPRRGEVGALVPEAPDRAARLRRFAFVVAVAFTATLPALAIRLSGIHPPPMVSLAVFGVSIVGAGFLLSWGAEAAEGHVAQGVALAGLAMITVLPEYAVDIYYTLKAGAEPGSDYVKFAAANMTGANRLLIGTGWPLIAVLYWWRSRERVVPLQPANGVEIAFLAIASLYAFVIVAKGQIDLTHTVVLGLIFAAYLWRLSRLTREVATMTTKQSVRRPPWRASPSGVNGP